MSRRCPRCEGNGRLICECCDGKGYVKAGERGFQGPAFGVGGGGVNLDLKFGIKKGDKVECPVCKPYWNTIGKPGRTFCPTCRGKGVISSAAMSIRPTPKP
jgi:DnaJ-class molecular chaperone